jgi:ABC-type multidrug transport system ATPase subunit
MTKLWISELVFNNETKITLDKNEIVVFVGPNNAGKSATLKDAVNFLKSKTNGK